MKKFKGSGRVGIEVSIREVSKKDVADKIGASLYSSIKETDAHPMFVELEVAEEGLSSGQMEIAPGVWQNTSKWWPAKVIRQLVEKFKPSGGWFAKLFEHHSAPTDPNGARNMAYGKIVGSELLKRAGKAVAKLIAYVEPGLVRDGIKDGTYDVCSLETLAQFSYDAGKWIAEQIDQVFGVTVADSRQQTPGFASARVCNVIQELEQKRVKEENGDDEDDHGGRSSNRGGRSQRRTRMDFSISEVKVWLSENAIPPEKLYSPEELVKFPVVRGAIDGAIEEAIDTRDSEHKTKLAAIEAEKQALQKVVEEKDKEISGAKEQLKPFEEKLKRDKLAETIRQSDMLKDATEKEAQFIVDHVPVSLMDENDADKRGAKIKTAIESAKASIDKYGLKFDSGTSKTTDNQDGVPPQNRSDGDKVPPLFGAGNPLSHKFGKKEA